MKRNILFSLFIALLFLSSCLTIHEKYTIHKDGSGSFEYIIDMSELYSIMESFASDEDMKSLQETDLSESFAEIIPELEEINGISNVSLTGLEEEYIFGISLDFADEVSLNKALAIIMKDQGEDGSRFVEISKKKFTRYHITSEEFSREALLGAEGAVDESLVSGMLEGMKYKLDISFARKVKSVQTRAEIIDEDLHSVSVEAGFNAMLEDSEYLKTIIKTK